jgi:hypothetical protein
MVERILVAMDERRILIRVPVAALHPLIAVAAQLLPNPPVTPSLLELLEVDNTVPENALVPVFGVSPTPFAPEELRYLQQITALEALRSLFTR